MGTEHSGELSVNLIINLFVPISISIFPSGDLISLLLDYFNSPFIDYSIVLFGKH